MSLNNQMYKFYSEMTKGHRENNPAVFEHGVRSWMELDPENPFKENVEASTLFFSIKKGYTIWKRGDIDRNINYRRMTEAARALCELNPKRPYKFNKAEDEEDRRKAEELEEQEKKQAEENAKLEAEKKAAELQAKAEAEEEEKDMYHVFGIVEKESKLSKIKAFFKR